jgi:peroxiredoxin
MLPAACSRNPGFSLQVADVAGIQQWLLAHRGAPILVNFWATWCVPCCEELPDFVAGTRGFRANGGVVVGIAMERMVRGVSAAAGEAKVRARAPSLGIDFPVLVCSDADAIAVREALHIDLGALPATWVIDREGHTVELHEGKADRDGFAALGRSAAGS